MQDVKLHEVLAFYTSATLKYLRFRYSLLTCSGKLNSDSIFTQSSERGLILLNLFTNSTDKRLILFILFTESAEMTNDFYFIFKTLFTNNITDI